MRPSALIREIISNLHENSRLVNVSDGGHIENLAGIELLRRRCRFIIIGDGEADGDHHFHGLANLIQTARIDLGVEIDIKADALRLRDDGLCEAHWTIGQVHYPGTSAVGYLLYLKSSLTGDEDEVIQQYRAKQSTFPHESTADQAFGEGQFEAYRSLGQHIGDSVLSVGMPMPTREVDDEPAPESMSYTDVCNWFDNLWQVTRSGTKDRSI